MGNCFERNLTDIEEVNSEPTSEQQTNSSSRHRSRNRSNSHRHHRSSHNHYTRLGNNYPSSSSSSIISINSIRNMSHSQDINQNYLHGTSVGSFQSTNGSLSFSPSSSLPSSLHMGPVGSLATSGSMSQQVFYLTPNVQRTADQLTEEEQIKLLKRMALIQQLPCGFYDENKKNKECVICMIDFEIKDQIKCLPCMHSFHQSCIDSWLVRSLICPSCMEPVDAGLLSAYENE